MIARLVAFAVIVVVATPVRAAPRPVVVVTLGDDPAAAGMLQREVEDGVRARAVLGGPEHLRGVLAVPAAPPRAGDPAAAERALDQAKEAFYAGTPDAALTALDRAEAALGALVAREPRARVQLWRVAILQGAARDGEARAAAALAYQIDPRLTVDLAVFWPSLAELVERARPRGFLHVEIDALPDDARVRVDGVPVARTFDVVAGVHRIVVDAPGRRAVEIEQAISIDTRLAVPMPYEIVAHDRALAALVAGAQPALVAVDATLVVVGVSVGQVRARVGAATFGPVPLVDRATAIAWVASQVAAPVRAQTERRLSLAIAASVGGATLTRSVSGPDADVSLSVGGARVAVRGGLTRVLADRWAFDATLDLAAIALGTSDLHGRGVSLPTSTRVAGGNVLTTRARGLVRRAIGPFGLAAGIGAQLERIGSRAVDAAYFAPGTWLALGGEVAVAVRVGRWYGEAEAAVSVVMVPLAGAEATDRLELAVAAGAHVGDRWTFALGVRGSRASLLGDPGAPTELASASRTEGTLMFVAMVQRAL